MELFPYNQSCVFANKMAYFVNFYPQTEIN